MTIFTWYMRRQIYQVSYCGLTLRNKVQKLQNRAACVLTYSSYDVDAGQLFKLLGWKNLACQVLQVSARVGSKLS